MKTIALHWQILIGILAGILIGLLCIQFAGGKEFVTDWIKPFGTIFINLLKLIAIPLIIVSLIKGISDLKDVTQLSRLGVRTFGLYILTTVIAVTIGLSLVNLIQPGNFISEDTRQEMLQSFGGEVQDRIQPLKTITDSANTIVLKVVDLMMIFAPYGVFALISTLIAEAPSLDMFKALGMYALTVILGLSVLVYGVYATFVYSFGKMSPLKFFKGILPAQLLGFSTSSSAATLPVTMECAKENLHIRKDVLSFVLPIGATINMDGTCLYQGVAAVFIAQVMGYDLTVTQQLSVIATATLASIGAAAVPGAGILMLVIVLESIGVNPAGIALIFAVDRPLDMLRTATNITGDSMVALLMNRSATSEILPPQSNVIDIKPSAEQ